MASFRNFDFTGISDSDPNKSAAMEVFRALAETPTGAAVLGLAADVPIFVTLSPSTRSELSRRNEFEDDDIRNYRPPASYRININPRTLMVERA